ncbi:MAG: DUF2628 domain-containing protein [Helicobacteraceae bacterium]|jgi:hypothetical protein|nr:DUF2628 domain-containing protein [Helicobacteraceae bacterium]
MATSQWSNYDDKMLAAFVKKPAKTPFYRDLYERATSPGAPTLCWKWSWWAFFGGALFLLYRKTYLAALIVWAANLVLLTFSRLLFPGQVLYEIKRGRGLNESGIFELAGHVISWGSIALIAAIIVGGFTSYFIIKRYCELKAAIENKYATEEDRLAAMTLHGGTHQWVVKLVIALVIILSLVLIVGVVAYATAR